jgi:four helix bundle protein
MNRVEDLKVYQKSLDLLIAIYDVVKSFPKEEIYALTSQIKRASISVASNIAEGAGRNNKAEFNQFLGIVIGSCFEINAQIDIALQLQFISDEIHSNIKIQTEEIIKMTYALQKSLKRQ